MNENVVEIGGCKIGRGGPLALIGGPCVIESLDHCLMLADRIKRICRGLSIPFIFKESFDKANRTSIKGFRGPGLDVGLQILAKVREEIGLPVLSDVHLPAQAARVGEVCDCLQIPAFLCRQTDLLVAAAAAGRPVNIKKGQFMAPEQMVQAVNKVREAGNSQVLLTDRGTFFGYGRLVNDFTCIPTMQAFAPVVFDATHSCQLPGGQGTHAGGLRQFVPMLAKAAVAAGTDALFLEIHDNPGAAKSDPATVYPLDGLESLLTTCCRIREAVSAS